MNRRLPIKQIQDIPVSAYNGNVLFFNSQVVTFCNTTTKTLLGSHSFNTAGSQPNLNRVASVTGYGSWETSSAVSNDKLFIAAKLVSGGTTVLFEEIIERSQATFAAGYFKFEVLLDVMTNETITLSLLYDDTAPGIVIKSFELTGLDLSSAQIIVEVHGQMAANINPVSLNQAVISVVNLVQNPGFEDGLEQWVREPENRSNYSSSYPHGGNRSCRIFSGDITQQIDQENVSQTETTSPGYIYQSGIFQNPGDKYYIEFWHKNDDVYAYASTVSVPGYIDQPNNFADATQNFSIVSVYAFNSATLQKGPLLITVKTDKTYQKTSLVHTAVAGYDAIYFEMSPATFRSSAYRTAQSNLVKQVLDEAGLFSTTPVSTEFAFLMAVDYVLQPRLYVDDVRVSEVGLPFNASNKEIRLRQFTTQYVS